MISPYSGCEHNYLLKKGDFNAAGEPEKQQAV